MPCLSLARLSIYSRPALDPHLTRLGSVSLICAKAWLLHRHVFHVDISVCSSQEAFMRIWEADCKNVLAGHPQSRAPGSNIEMAYCPISTEVA